jgi:predicted 2-oxoglutarate/Fe(II)-dependent dioxygenase YbiX
MNTINIDLARALGMIERPGNFYTTGKIEFLAPRLEVTGVGPIALPLLPVQAEQLVAVAEQAPYGKGEETLVDTSVRRTWQIDAERVRIEGKHWAETLESIVARVATGLGVAAAVEADLYKLLIYDAGSFFISHRDTEKVSGMFATLVIVLPSIYTGGELVIRHRDQEVQLDLTCSESCELAFAAFYADCVHAVLPVTSGCRLTLIYNLRRTDGGSPPKPPDYASEQSQIAELLRKWSEDQAVLEEDNATEKLIYPLEHAYTPAELSFASLKGADAAVADVLAGAAEQAGCELYLALVSIEESGGAKYNGYYGSYRRGRYHDPDDDEFEIGEVYDRRLTLTDWRKPDDTHPEMGQFPFNEDELCPPEAFEEIEPDEMHFHEATGNEGASFERTYRRAGLVLWPRTRRLAVFNQVGLTLTLPYLGQLVNNWETGGGDRESALWKQAHELSKHMLRTWPPERWRYQRGDSTEPTAEMLELLIRLRDVDRLDYFLSHLSAGGVYGKGDNATLARTAELFSPQRFAELLEGIVAHNAGEQLDACADLLVRISALQDLRINLVPSASALLKALPGPSPTPAEAWRRIVPMEPACMIDLLNALVRIDASLADRAVEQVLTWPKTYDLDATLVPAVVQLVGTPWGLGSTAVQRLRTASLENLRSRISEPLEPPRDWARASTLACRCPHCTELGQFLADAERKTWTFKAVENLRSHVTDSISRSHVDLDTRTETQGRPYTLVCTKNQASYERRAQQRREDLENLARLEA